MLFEEKLIREVKKHAELYDRRTSVFRNRAARKEAWAKVANATKTPVKDCQGRWKSLRDRYIKETKLLAESDVSNEPQVKWMFYELMSFLKNAIPRPYSLSSNAKSDTEYIDDESYNSFMDVVSSSERRRLDYEDEEFISLEENPLEVASSPPPKREKIEDDNYDYGHMTTKIERSMTKNMYNEKEKNNPYLGVIGRLMKKVNAEHKDDLYMDIINYVHEKVKELNGE